jgi:prepilin-type processing-associated H-X9-DG protein
MKLDLAKSESLGLTQAEVIVLLGIVSCFFFFLFFFILPVEQASKRHEQRIYCVSNLRQMSMAFQTWADDHNKKFPMEISATNGGTMESIASGNVAGGFEIMSNELPNLKILICPADSIHPAVTNFANGLGNSNISYFVSLDADEGSPERILSGDDNFEISRVPVHSGLLQFSNDAPIGWSTSRHMGVGNLSFADGSVAEEFSNSFHNAMLYATKGVGTMTNRFAIP